MPTTENINNLNLNILTKEQLEGATINPNDIYLVTDDVLPIEFGGTGATTAEEALANLGASSPFWINFTVANSESVTSCDKTYEEIENAYNTGRTLYAMTSGNNTGNSYSNIYTLYLVDNNGFSFKYSNGGSESIFSANSHGFSYSVDTHSPILIAMKAGYTGSSIAFNQGLANIDKMMITSTYDTNGNGIVDNAEKVNGHTVNSDVPENAVFTDTVYTLPAASTSALGGVKIGDNISYSENNYIYLTKANVTSALGYTPFGQNVVSTSGNGLMTPTMLANLNNCVSELDGISDILNEILGA